MSNITLKLSNVKYSDIEYIGNQAISMANSDIEYLNIKLMLNGIEINIDKKTTIQDIYDVYNEYIVNNAE